MPIKRLIFFLSLFSSRVGWIEKSGDLIMKFGKKDLLSRERKLSWIFCCSSSPQTRGRPRSDRRIKRRKGRDGVSRNTGLCGDAIMMANSNLSRDVDVSCFHGIGGGAMIVVQSEKIRDTIALRFQPVRASDFFSLSLSLEYDETRDSTTSRIPSRSVTWQFTAPA